MVSNRSNPLSSTVDSYDHVQFNWIWIFSLNSQISREREREKENLIRFSSRSNNEDVFRINMKFQYTHTHVERGASLQVSLLMHELALYLVINGRIFNVRRDSRAMYNIIRALIPRSRPSTLIIALNVSRSAAVLAGVNFIARLISGSYRNVFRQAHKSARARVIHLDSRGRYSRRCRRPCESERERERRPLAEEGSPVEVIVITVIVRCVCTTTSTSTTTELCKLQL